MSRRLPSEQETDLLLQAFVSIIAERHGDKVVYSKDTEWLADKITAATKDKIGANTLRRFYGFDARRTPRQGTLDTLAAYAGFACWEDMLAHWQDGQAKQEPSPEQIPEPTPEPIPEPAKPKRNRSRYVWITAVIMGGLVGFWLLSGDPSPSRRQSLIGFSDTLIQAGGTLEVEAGAPEMQNLAVRFRGQVDGKRNCDGMIGENVTDIAALLPHTDFSYDFWVNVEDTIRLLPGIVSGYDSVRAARGGQNIAIFANAVGEGGKIYRGSGVSVGTNGLQIIEHEPYFFDVRLSARIPLKGWNHVFVVYRNNAPSLYVNGHKVGEAPPAPDRVYPMPNISVNIPVLEYLKGTFNGMVDEYRLWDTAMSDERVALLWDKKSHGRLNHLIIQWSFDDRQAKNLRLLSPFDDKPKNKQSFAYVAADIPIKGILWGPDPYKPTVLPVSDEPRYLWTHTVDSACISQEQTVKHVLGGPFNFLHLRYLYSNAVVEETATVRGK